ncbi:hypothetical protein Q8A73_014147 [Channa argus]|nr:hypothetical protein Q8A73_014147 [Channa argus]
MRFACLQVIRQVAYDSWSDELDWSLSLSGHIIVALEDASLIQMNVDMNGPAIIVGGRRRDVLSPVKKNEGATCPKESKQLLQPFYRVDVVLTFKETNHIMHWTMENTLPCTGRFSSRLASDEARLPRRWEDGEVLLGAKRTATADDQVMQKKMKDRLSKVELPL